MPVTAIPNVRSHSLRWLVALALVTAILPVARAQQQGANSPAGWPCGGRVDPSYFQLAEASGGHLLLLAPAEIGDSAALLGAFRDHPETILRLAGSINPGVHEFQVPVDSTVESVLFSMSVQCLQAAEVVRPSGAPAGGEGVTDFSNFRAERLVVVPRPEPGVWTLRVSGSGVAGVMVQAKSALRIEGVEFAPAGLATFTRMPAPGLENDVKITMSGHVTDVSGALVNGAFRRIAKLTFAPGDTSRSLISRFTPGTEGFRVLIEGNDARGAPFQRVHAPLFTAPR